MFHKTVHVIRHMPTARCYYSVPFPLRKLGNEFCYQPVAELYSHSFSFLFFIFVFFCSRRMPDTLSGICKTTSRPVVAFNNLNIKVCLCYSGITSSFRHNDMMFKNTFFALARGRKKGGGGGGNVCLTNISVYT